MFDLEGLKIWEFREVREVQEVKEFGLGGGGSQGGLVKYKRSGQFHPSPVGLGGPEGPSGPEVPIGPPGQGSPGIPVQQGEQLGS